MFAVWSIPFLQSASLVVLAILLLGFKFLTYHFGKWKRLGVPHVKPTPLFGNLGERIMGRVPMVELVQSLYHRYHEHRYFGIYMGRDPVLVLCDPDLVHTVIVRDFAHFYDRVAGNTSFKHDRLFDHLFNMRGQQWKAVRTKLSPTFSGFKLKSMLADIQVCTARLAANLNDQIVKKNGIVNVSETSAQFTTDSIGCCAFGIDCNSLSDPKSIFRNAGREVLKPTRRTFILNFIRLAGLGWLIDVFRIRGMPDRIYNFFENLFEIAIELHNNGKNNRNNYISQLVKVKANEEESEEKLLTLDVLVANSFIFFVAGYETSASTISYCLYELAMNLDIQVKLREKIKETLDVNEGKISYNTLKDFKFLDMVINETLRLHPPVPVLNRSCTKKYTLPGSEITFNVGDRLMIPMYAIHHDPKYYPNPEIFDPERFSEENKSLRPNGTFFPFGDGPRICIGRRFAIMEVKTGLVEILSKFEVYPCKDTQNPIKIKVRSFLLTPNEPIRLMFKKVE